MPYKINNYHYNTVR